LALTTVEAPGVVLRVPPAWAASGAQALRALAKPLAAAQPLPTLRAAAIPAAWWPPVEGANRGLAIVLPDEWLLILPSRQPNVPLLTQLLDEQLMNAIKTRIAASASPTPRSAGPSIVADLSGLTDATRGEMHLRAATSLRSSGREGWRQCAAGDTAWCARVLRPTAEDSADGFLGARDYRARVLRDTFPLERGMKQQCIAGDDAACRQWVKRFDLPPNVALPKEVRMSVAMLAVQHRPDAPSRLFAPVGVDFAGAAAATAGLDLADFTQLWRDSLVAAQRRSHDADGRMAWQAVPWLALLGLLAVGGRRDAR
jgi:hypothetical protein